jgi:HAD superfamily hydrolase (TIGR01509 family)
MARRTRAAVFDIDGTLIDSVDGHARAWQEVFARLGLDVPFEKIRGQIGKGGDQLMPVFLPRDVVDRQGEEIERERLALFKSKYLPQVRPFPGTRELFQKLKAEGLTVVLASSAKGEELETYKTIARVDDLVDDATSSDDAERSKPHPDIFEAALSRLPGIEPAEAVAVGDTPYDAQAATKAGLRAVGVLCGGFPEADLRAAGCVAIYRDPADLLARLDSSPLAPPTRG